MKRVKLFLLAAVLCTSCATSKFLTSDVKSFEITEMLKIEPFSYISLIETGNNITYSESISNSTQLVLNESLQLFKGQLRLSSEEIKPINSSEMNILEQEVNHLIMSAERNRSIEGIQITPFIESLLNASDKRFGLIIVQFGFTRDKGNYRNQVAKGIGMGIGTAILTMGMVSVYQVSTKANSTLHAMIVDNKNKNVAFYNKSVLKDKEPTERENIIKHLNKVFDNYFWRK